MLTEQIKNDWREALKSKSLSKSILSEACAEIAAHTKINKQTDDEACQSLIRRMIKQRADVRPDYERSGRTDLLNKIDYEASILASYLPQQMSEEEIVAEVVKVISQQSSPNKGSVIKEVLSRLGKMADGKVISRVVTQQLSDIGMS